MRISVFTGILAFLGLLRFEVAFTQSTPPSIYAKAFERSMLSGVAPTAEIKVGGEEKPVSSVPAKTAYFIYLVTKKMSNSKVDKVWIKKELFTATLTRVTANPVILENGKYSDTLFNYADETVWQIIIKDKVTAGNKPTKDIAAKLATHELVIQLKDKNGKPYTRTVEKFTQLKPFAGM